MKIFMLKAFHIFMAIVVIVSSTGFGLVEHSCTLKGKSTAFHKSATGCCAKHAPKSPVKNQAQVKKTACCSENEKYENIEYSSSASQIIAKFIQKTFDTFQSFVNDFITAIFKTLTKSRLTFNNHPPSHAYSGQEIRIFQQSFLI
jgi:hypothetical protein